MTNTTWNDTRFGPGSYEHASQEDRSVPRLSVHIPASLRAAGARAAPTIVRGLSLGGFAATSPTRLEPHQGCWLSLPGLGAVQAEVIWWEAGQFGAAFATLLDPAQFDAIVAEAGTNA